MDHAPWSLNAEEERKKNYNKDITITSISFRAVNKPKKFQKKTFLMIVIIVRNKHEHLKSRETPPY